MEVSDADFDELVAAGLDSLPPELTQLMDNVVVLVEAHAPADDPTLLGRYDGIPLTARDSNYTFAPPDRILLFRDQLLAMCATREELVEEVRITVVHEVAHHFGIDDATLHELGYG